MNPYRRWIVFAIFVVSCVALGLTSAAFATNYWTEATAQSNTNITGQQEITNVNFGIFSGTKSQNIIQVPTDFAVKDLYNECNDFMKFGLWVCTILFLALGMTFGIVSAVFSVINTIMTPIEAITGLQGLYIWNGIACGFSLLGVIMWTVLFYVSFDGQVGLKLARIQCEEINGSEVTNVGYSFWLAVVATILYVCNIPLAFAAGRNWLNKQAHNVLDDKPADGLIMLY